MIAEGTHRMVEEPNRIELYEGGTVWLPMMTHVVEQAKQFGWGIYEGIGLSGSQVFRVHCNHGHGPSTMLFDAGDIQMGPAPMDIVDLVAQAMHYTTQPGRAQESDRTEIWRGQCYECGCRHMAFNGAPTWVMGLSIIRYAAKTNDVNIPAWLRSSWSAWGKWTESYQPNKLTDALMSWARRDVERYG